MAPIVDKSYLDSTAGQVTSNFINASVDPLPQALVLTSIVIGLGSLALMISVCIRIYQKYGTFDITEIRRLRG
jgi:multicomponent Na+:H+ antiporter subunit C